MKHNRTLFTLALLVGAACLLVLAGCRGQSGVAGSEIAFVAAPNLDGTAGNSNVRFLGRAIDPGSGLEVEGYAIIHYAPGYGPPDRSIAGKPTDPGKPSKPPKEPDSSCYEFLANGARWKSVEPWLFNAENPDGMSKDALFNLLDLSVGKWEDAAIVDILGAGTRTENPLFWDWDSPDNLNEVYFGPLEEGTIAVTLVWGVFGGPPKFRALSEWDMVFNTFYHWSDSGAADKMDFENIATHELGHSCGLADLYTTECNQETMYGISWEGDIEKRTLAGGDITGIKALYK